MRTAELLLELAPEALPLRGGCRPLLLPPPLLLDEDATMCAGRSFHSVSGRVFWKDSEGAGDGEAECDGGPEALAFRGGPPAPLLLMGGRLTAAAVVVGTDRKSVV